MVRVPVAGMEKLFFFFVRPLGEDYDETENCEKCGHNKCNATLVDRKKGTVTGWSNECQKNCEWYPPLSKIGKRKRCQACSVENTPKT